jgi:hypothetical protein
LCEGAGLFFFAAILGEPPGFFPRPLLPSFVLLKKTADKVKNANEKKVTTAVSTCPSLYHPGDTFFYSDFVEP